ncbi:MAG: cobalamin-binding protein [Deltaproteobacteria bacterium]|nr:cobalamin-binding protein [Deltaproteobacteria bacterium]
MRLKWLPAFAAFMALLSIAPCAGAQRVVEDQLGRSMRVPDDPGRIISLAPSITEIVFALGQGHRLVGATQFSDFPPEARRLPKVGSYVHLDLERIVALRPDLCIAVKDGNPRRIAERLEELNIPVYAVDPRDLKSVMRTIGEVGRLLNRQERAALVKDRMARRIQDVTSRVRKTGERPGVFFQIGITPIVAVGTDTFIHELIELACGKNLTAGPTPYPRYSREQVLALKPEIFIITSMARGGAFDRVKAQWRRWPQMPAVKNGRIHVVDSNIFDRPSPRLVDALELLGRLIHPEMSKENR